jgi:hypothetical protein
MTSSDNQRVAQVSPAVARTVESGLPRNGLNVGPCMDCWYDRSGYWRSQ